jgi:hypothetical protein
MKVLQAIVLGVGLAFFALVVWAIATASFFASFAAITADPWGLVTLADLYLGFLLIGLVIWAVEGPGLRAILIALSILVLGNVVTAIWLAIRLPRLMAMSAAFHRKIT